MSRLEYWVIYGHEQFGQIACGEVHGDSRFKDGDDIRTSRIQTINRQEKYVQTLHTRYELGVEGSMDALDKVWPPHAFPNHMFGDVRRHNENVKAGRNLCAKCSATGNQLMSMFQKCDVCLGKGYLESEKSRG